MLHPSDVSEIEITEARLLLAQLREVYCDLTYEDRLAAKQEMTLLSQLIGESQ